MSVRRMGILTRDFGLYHDLVRMLRERRFPFASLAFGEIPDPSIGVVVTSWKDAVSPGLPEDLPVVAVSVDREGREDLEGAIAQALRILEGVREYIEVVIGIDPGQRPGVAVLADGRLLHATQAYQVRDVSALVRGFLNQFPHERARVRVGHGAPRDRDRILADLWPLRGEDVTLEVVDETGTTPPTGTAPYPPDVAAAIDIARTPGQSPLRRPPEPQDTPNESDRRGFAARGSRRRRRS